MTADRCNRVRFNRSTDERDVRSDRNARTPVQLARTLHTATVARAVRTANRAVDCIEYSSTQLMPVDAINYTTGSWLHIDTWIFNRVLLHDIQIVTVCLLAL